MTTAVILSQIRTPAGRLKGYNLSVDGVCVPYTCEEIKRGIRDGSLSVSGMTISHAGALILNSPLPVHEPPVEGDPVKAAIVDAVRSPNGRLKGYVLRIGLEEAYYPCEIIKEKLSTHELSIAGLTLNNAGALIAAPAAGHQKSSGAVSDALSGTAKPAGSAASVSGGTSADVKDSNGAPDLSILRHMPVFDPLKISSALEPYQKNYKAAGKKNGAKGKNVAFVKRRIT
ncbi:MAG: hypothetical protein IJV14_09385 [Lachnospiraceae bacterium]|nr:hypothetical protein [Lachnospiraceae bacterium]